MTSHKKKILIIVAGATAVGKTAAALHLANYFKTEIISADSRQFYREMNIGTAKPNATELQSIPHHFINNLSIQDAYSVGQYEREMISFLDNFYQSNDVAVLVGGTGLYINAVVNGLDEFPNIPAEIKKAVATDYLNYGIGFLQDELQKSDPQYFSKVDIHNSARLIRALEVTRATQKPFSDFTVAAKVERNFIPIFIKLELPRAELYNRINTRVDTMLQSGLLNEVESLRAFKNLRTLNTVGYTELFDFFDGKVMLPEAVEKIKQHTRNYAKRQITWFHRPEFETIFAPSDLNKMIAYIENSISK